MQIVIHAPGLPPDKCGFADIHYCGVITGICVFRQLPSHMLMRCCSQVDLQTPSTAKKEAQASTKLPFSLPLKDQLLDVVWIWGSAGSLSASGEVGMLLGCFSSGFFLFSPIMVLSPLTYITLNMATPSSDTLFSLP